MRLPKQINIFTGVVIFVTGLLLANNIIPPLAVIPIIIVLSWLRTNDEKVAKEVAEG